MYNNLIKYKQKDFDKIFTRKQILIKLINSFLSLLLVHVSLYK